MLVAVVQEASEELSSCWLVHVVLVTVVLEVKVALVAVVLGVTVVQVHEVWRFPWCLPRLCKRPRNACDSGAGGSDELAHVLVEVPWCVFP